MNLFGLSPGELLLIMVVAMIVLGPEKLPEVAASAGKWIAEFRRATQELSRQFAEDNPFAEIQRALNFEEPPAAVQTPVEAEPAQLEAPPIVPTPAVATVPTAVPNGVPAPVTSDYFARPATYLAIVDEWAHGSLLDAPPSNHRLDWRTWLSVSDDWTHGVPVVVDPPPARPEPGSDEVLVNAILSEAASREGSEVVAEGDGSDTTPAPSDVPGIPVGATVEETESAPPALDRLPVPEKADVAEAGPSADRVVVAPSEAPATNGVAAHLPEVAEATPAGVGSHENHGLSDEDERR